MPQNLILELIQSLFLVNDGKSAAFVPQNSNGVTDGRRATDRPSYPNLLRSQMGYILRKQAALTARFCPGLCRIHDPALAQAMHAKLKMKRDGSQARDEATACGLVGKPGNRRCNHCHPRQEPWRMTSTGLVIIWRNQSSRIQQKETCFPLFSPTR